MAKLHSQETCDRIRRLRANHTQVEVAAILRIRNDVVSRIELRGYQVGFRKRLRPIPYDFAIQAAHMSVAELAVHYTAGKSTIQRWCSAVNRAPRWRPVAKIEVAPRDKVVAALKAHTSIKRAAQSLGIGETTLRKWRDHYSLTNRGAPVVDRQVGWVERYVEEVAKR